MASETSAEEPETAGLDVELVACNLCGGVDTRELYRSADYRFGVDTREWPVVVCRACGLGFVNPRPTRQGIERYYPPAFFRGRSAVEQAARFAMQREYLADLTPGRLLDVGCASGDWMKGMAERGWRVAGVETSPHADNPHGLEIHSGGFPETAPWPAASFDAATAWAVFEHLHDPKAAFRRVAELLRTGGRLVALVTNLNSLFSRFSYREDIPRHLYFFSERVLRRYGDNCGLALERVVHDTRFYGGAGRGTLGVQLWKALGRPVSGYFRHQRLPLARRVADEPVLGTATVAARALERLIVRDALTRWLRASGHVVAIFEKR